MGTDSARSRRSRFPATPRIIWCYVGTAAFTGDAVLGEGSVFVAPDPGALVAYLDGLTRLGSAG